MAMNLTQKILSAHLLSGELVPGSEISIRIDQTLTQDSTGTMGICSAPSRPLKPKARACWTSITG